MVVELIWHIYTSNEIIWEYKLSSVVLGSVCLRNWFFYSCIWRKFCFIKLFFILVSRLISSCTLKVVYVNISVSFKIHQIEDSTYLLLLVPTCVCVNMLNVCGLLTVNVCVMCSWFLNEIHCIFLPNIHILLVHSL